MTGSTEQTAPTLRGDAVPLLSWRCEADTLGWAPLPPDQLTTTWRSASVILDRESEVLDALLDRYARARPQADRGAVASGFLDRWAWVVASCGILAWHRTGRAPQLTAENVWLQLYDEGDVRALALGHAAFAEVAPTSPCGPDTLPMRSREELMTWLGRTMIDRHLGRVIELLRPYRDRRRLAGLVANRVGMALADTVDVRPQSLRDARELTAWFAQYLDVPSRWRPHLVVVPRTQRPLCRRGVCCLSYRSESRCSTCPAVTKEQLAVRAAPSLQAAATG